MVKYRKREFSRKNTAMSRRRSWIRVPHAFQNGDNSLIGKMYSLHGIDAGSNPAYLPKQKR